MKFLVLAIAFVAAVGLAVMLLWNWLLPPLMGWPAIGFAQAVGLLVLCRILFGGFFHRGSMHWRRRFAERWEKMTPEERAHFREGMRGRCGHGFRGAGEAGPPASTTAPGPT